VEGSISIVVPTRDRPASLRRCLAALAGEGAENLDVVVVDDGSRDRAAVEAAIAAALPEARLVRSAGRGPATARNVGVRAAAGEVVCLTDDDCEPCPGWASLLAAAALEGGAAGGRTVAPGGAAAPILASQAITSHLQLDSLDANRRLRFAPTCNMAVRRELLLRLPFDTRYPEAAGEDRDWWARAIDAGVTGRYEAHAVVVHRQQLDLAAFLRQQYRYGRGAGRFRAGSPRRRRGLARPGFYIGLLARGFALGPATGALIVGAQGATAAGIAAERLGRRRV
jgi:glycosyltransferase involved in cell wall biosynthesis